MCHHYEVDWSERRAVEDDSESDPGTDEGRPSAFEDDREVDVEIVTDGGDDAE